MVDFNAEAEKALSVLPYAVCFYYPERFNKLPVISFYNLSERGAFACDDTETVSRGWVQTDVWAKEPAECGRIAAETAEAMAAGGWIREMSMDMPKTNGIYHRTLRFVKDCINNNNI